MISAPSIACERFQRVAWDWLHSGELTRTNNFLSPLEELCGYNYGFVYLMQAAPDRFKIGFSLHPMRRLRELQPQYGQGMRLRACFVGEPPVERFVHRRFRSLRVVNELFLAHPRIEEYFQQTRRETLERLRAVHRCSFECPQLVKRLDLRMLGLWLARS